MFVRSDAAKKAAAAGQDQIGRTADWFLGIKNNLRVFVVTLYFGDQLRKLHGVLPGTGGGVPGGVWSGVPVGEIAGCAAGAPLDAAGVVDVPG
jgi:hypothetical protein